MRAKRARPAEPSNTQRSCLVVERLPAYEPELNPVEGLWSSLKAVELANLATPSLGEVIDQAHQGIERVRRTPHLSYSFLRHAGPVGLLTRRQLSHKGVKCREP
jgi:hypothetical protein